MLLFRLFLINGITDLWVWCDKTDSLTSVGPVKLEAAVKPNLSH